jgi:peptidylprolyl isomerase
MFFFRSAILACALLACSSSDEEPAGDAAGTAEGLPGLDAPPDVAAAPADAEVRPSGLASRRLVAGTGTRSPTATDTVRVHYTGWQTDGERFDSSVTRGRPLEFRLNGVIQGWTEGLQLMVEGESRRLWIPEALAYRGRQAPYGDLVFDVQLLAILPQ